MPGIESHALTLALSRFAGEGTQAERLVSLAPSTAKRERVGVRVRPADSSMRAKIFCPCISVNTEITD
jgi:hypothetical protein